ncbi:MAG: arsenate reductase (glutaredoxin) [Planctomycetes bacterium]|nr:arsenate reductase (glutaredoxin) [Planctomycetota bacterium]
MEELIAWINPRCSKCRGLVALLKASGKDYRLREYLEDPPSVAELQQALVALGTNDPHMLVRRKESVYSELGLAEASPEVLLEALAAHPNLLERPVLFAGDRAMVARPPEKANELLN